MTQPPETVPIPGTPYIALARDDSITRDCLVAGRLDWDARMRDLLLDLPCITDGARVLDVGAYIGDTSIMFVEAACRVVAIEPQPDAYYCLSHNMQVYGHLAVCINAAASDNNDLLVRHGGHGGNLGARWVGKRNVREGVPVQAGIIDDFPPETLDGLAFVKIDVEGFEPYALRGMAETLKRYKPLMLMEVNQPALWAGHMTIDDVDAALDYCGYRRGEVAVGKSMADRWDVWCEPKG